MQKLPTLLFILFALATPAGAQSFIGAGVSVTRSSSYDPSPLTQKDGGKTFVGPYVEASVALPYKLQARALAEYLPEPTLNSIFTSDSDTGRIATSELRFKAGARYTFESDRVIDPFVEAGVDGFKQYFRKTRRPDPLPPAALTLTYGEVGAYDQPSVSLNPYLSIGIAVGEYHEASFSRLFEGALNDSRLSGYRAEYSYMHPLRGEFTLKLGAQVDYLTFRDAVGGYIAPYFKHDAVFKARIGLIYR
jgi:hypothetical protein